MQNYIEYLVTKYPGYKWNFKNISKNTNLTEWFIIKNIDQNWNFDLLSENNNLKIETILEYPNKNWNYYKITQNPTVKINHIIDNPEKPWDMSYIYEHIADVDFVRLRKTEYLKYKKSIIHNKNVPHHYFIVRINDFKKSYIYRMNQLNDTDIYYNEVFSNNRNIGCDDIQENINMNIDWNYGISRNKNITIDFVKNNPDKCWNYYYLLQNLEFKLDFVEKLIQTINIDWSSLSKHSNLTIEFIEKYIDKPLNFTFLSKNANITIDFIFKYKNKDWDYIYIYKYKKIPSWYIDYKIQNFNNDYIFFNYLSKNIHLTPDIVEKYETQNWNWEYLINMSHLYKHYYKQGKKVNFKLLSSNKYLSLKFIEKNLNLLDIDILSSNTFNREQEFINSEKMKNCKKILEEIIMTAWLPYRFRDWCLTKDENDSIIEYNM